MSDKSEKQTIHIPKTKNPLSKEESGLNKVRKSSIDEESDSIAYSPGSICSPLVFKKKRDPLEDGISCLEIVGQLGNDLMPVNAARISFGIEKDHVTPGDEKLLNFLAKNKHMSPFRHAVVQLRIKMPLFVAGQWYKHVVGCSFTEADYGGVHAWNQLSLRYTSKTAHEFYCPTSLRVPDPKNRQAGTDPFKDKEKERRSLQLMLVAMESACDIYDKLVADGVCKEQARTVLPSSVYTEVVWTASLQAVFNFVQLRKHPDAQREIQLYAIALEEMMHSVFPYSWKALVNASESS